MPRKQDEPKEYNPDGSIKLKRRNALLPQEATPEIPATPLESEPSFHVPESVKNFTPYEAPPIIRDTGAASGGAPAENTGPDAQEREIPDPTLNETQAQPGETPTGEQPLEDQGFGGEQEGVSGAEQPLSDISQADKHRAAKAAAEQIIGVYCDIKPKVFEKLAKPNQKKINKRIADGELDPEVKIETLTKTDTFRGHIQYITERAGVVFTPSDSFREEIIPPLTQVFETAGVGMTPIQQVIAIGARDIVTSVFQMIELTGYTREISEYAADLTKQLAVNTKELQNENDILRAKIARMEATEQKTEPDFIVPKPVEHVTPNIPIDNQDNA